MRLNLKRLDLYLDLDRPIYEKELNQMREMVRRRAMREPLQYILGETVFSIVPYELINVP